MRGREKNSIKLTVPTPTRSTPKKHFFTFLSDNIGKDVGSPNLHPRIAPASLRGLGNRKVFGALMLLSSRDLHTVFGSSKEPAGGSVPGLT